MSSQSSRAHLVIKHPIEPDAEPAVRLNDVRLTYETKEGKRLDAVDPTTLTIRAGEMTALVGPSGCGKTSLLRIIAGLTPPSGGEVAVFGQPPTVAQQHKRLGLVFQEPALLAWRSVADNIRLGLQLNPRETHSSTEIDELIEMVGLRGFERYRPAELSGGMQQRVALARALAIDPPLLLLDEPFAALDEITREQMRYEVQRLWGISHDPTEPPRSAIFVTHSVPEAVAIADRVLVMSPRPGRIVADIPVSTPRPRRPEHEHSDRFINDTAIVRAALRSPTTPAVPLDAA
ncbi:MAG: ABC transporter ATP-binding protein [Chloroflexi bacterium]|nr:ABC transporter ATP-binding protein [Chloroflexota bacterium]MCY3696476.1 ABC transporter ATP-binding protein [Chloroflexota bacterium]